MKIAIVNHPSGTVRVIQPEVGQRIIQNAVDGCERCTTDAFVPHFSCMYAGRAMGHSESHCTASACY